MYILHVEDQARVLVQSQNISSGYKDIKHN